MTLSSDARQGLLNCEEGTEIGLVKNNSVGNFYGSLFYDNKYGVALNSYIRGNNNSYTVDIPLFVGSNINASTGIYIKSKNPNDAFKVLFLANTERKYGDLLTYGIEGINYTKENDIVKPTTTQSKVSNYEFNLFYNSTPSINNPNEAEEALKINLNTNEGPYIGFNFNPKGYEKVINDTYNISMKNLDIWKSDNLEAELERVRKELSAAGVDKLTEEVRRQVEEWKKIVE